MSLDLLTIGRVSVDLFAEQQDVSMTQVETFRKSIGGTSTNVAVAAARLGHSSATATRVGNDKFGNYIRHALAHTFGVDTRFVVTDPNLPTSLAFAELNPPDDPELIFYRYPKAPDQNLSLDDLDLDVVKNVPIFWVPASCFAWEPSRSTVIACLQHRNRAAHTIIDLDYRSSFWPSPEVARAHINPMLQYFNIAIGNRTECEVALGTDDPDEAIEALFAAGLTTAIIKLGSKGVLAAQASASTQVGQTHNGQTVGLPSPPNSTHAPAQPPSRLNASTTPAPPTSQVEPPTAQDGPLANPPDGYRQILAPLEVEVVCGLGAGDAFGGAFCHGLLSGWNLDRTVEFANAAGAIVASRLMCADAMPTLSDITDLLATTHHQQLAGTR